MTNADDNKNESSSVVVPIILINIVSVAFTVYLLNMSSPSAKVFRYGIALTNIMIASLLLALNKGNDVGIMITSILQLLLPLIYLGRIKWTSALPNAYGKNVIKTKMMNE